MRLFVMLLIFAIGFSGYSAAAHAFMKESCNPVVMAQAASVEVDMPCPGHSAVEQNQQEDTDQSDQASKGKCMDCTHCCVSHAFNMPESSFNFLQPSAELNPLTVNGYAGDFLFSLLRPPKSLV